MEVYSNNRRGQRQKQLSMGKENRNPVQLYCPTQIKNKRKFLELESNRVSLLRGQDAEHHLTEISKGDRSNRALLSTPKYLTERKWEVRSVPLFQTLMSSSSLSKVLTSYLDIACFMKLTQTCRRYRNELPLQREVAARIAGGRLQANEAIFICMSKATSPTHRYGTLKTVPCKFDEQLRVDLEQFREEERTQILAVTREVRLSHPRLEYHSSFLCLIRNLTIHFDVATTFRILETLITQKELYKLYDTYEQRHELVRIVRRMVDYYTKSLPAAEKELLVEALINSALKSCFTKDILQGQSWIEFFTLFITNGWEVVAMLLSSLIRTQGKQETLCTLPQMAQNFIAETTHPSLRPKCELDFVSFFNQPTRVTRARELGTPLGGKRASRNRTDCQLKFD